jgi:hypothetical protein
MSISNSIYLSRIKNNVSTFFNQPYPFYYEGKSLKVLVLFFFIMTVIFNYAFEPFNVEYAEHKMPFLWISVIHALTPSTVLTMIGLFGNLFKFEREWSVRKEIMLVLLFFLLVGVFQFLIRDIIYANENNWSLHYLYEEVRNTFLVGTLFVLVLIPYNFARLDAKHKRSAENVNNTSEKDLLSSLPQKDKVVFENYEFTVDQFLFAKSEGNYIEIYLNQSLKNKILVRATLKHVESVLCKYPFIVKTHRSFLINCNYIKEVNGNAQGYQLQIDNYTIPVSRSLIGYFELRLKQLKEL